MLFRNTLDSFLAKDFADQPYLVRLTAHTGKIALASFRDMTDGQLSLRAMSLVYTTLITLVPLLAISFSVLKGFGVHNEVEPWLLNFLEPLGEQAKEIADKIIMFVDNIEVGVLGAVGLAFLVYSVIGLMQKIESAFNFIWRVTQSRTLARRFSDYLSVLVFGPFLIFLSAGLTTAANASGYMDYLTFLTEQSHIAGIIKFFTLLIPTLIMALGFCFFYIYMPNTRVKFKAGLIGGIFAAIVWKLMGWVFANFIAVSATYVAVYAAFATLILFMVWVYLSWLVVLMGANISFYIQHPKFIQFARQNIDLSNEMRLALGLSIVEEMVVKQYEYAEGVCATDLSRRFKMPMMAVQNMLDALEVGHIFAAGEDPNDSRNQIYYPARPLDQITLGDVLKALQSYSEKGGFSEDQVIKAPKTIGILEALDKAWQPLASQSAASLFRSDIK